MSTTTDKEGRKLKIEWAAEVVKRAERDVKRAKAAVTDAEIALEAAKANEIEVQLEMRDFEPHLESTFHHEGGFDVEYWWMEDKPLPVRFEYRIVGTTMVVREVQLRGYGTCYAKRCGNESHERSETAYGFHPQQVGATRCLGDAWDHWQRYHVPAHPVAGEPEVVEGV